MDKEKYDRQILEEEKRKIYSPTTLFKGNVTADIIDPALNLYLDVKKESFYHKLKNLIKKFYSFLKSNIRK